MSVLQIPCVQRLCGRRELTPLATVNEAGVTRLQSEVGLAKQDETGEVGDIRTRFSSLQG